MTDRLHLGLLEDHLLVAESVRLKAKEWGFDEFTHFDSSKSLKMDLQRGVQFDLLLMDLGLPNSDVEQTLWHLRQNYPSLKILFLSGAKSPELVTRLIQAGGRGFVSKMAGWDEVSIAVRMVMSGQIYIDSRLNKANINAVEDPFSQLSAREYKVCSHVVSGKSYKEIAEVMFIEVNTVGTYVSRIHKKLGTHSREELLGLALQFGHFS